ncbi:BadF/BadG/BcrA/BcrD ATPase family protein [Herbidospora cretacea]|uniref:BadF/BadG/BcrA/BcrD ATPase family protein n=1 Tax=Herbidospora cretacea TaxID=28444 RepID=UPI00054D1F7F|nr:BadF/BadG/BcrA/BcrD ATPase family protein [Herbidospora cretacea]
MKVLAGLDIGGTKTHLRFETPAGRVLSDVVDPTDTWSAAPVDRAARWIADLVERHRPAGATLGAIAVGAQGCDDEHHCAELSHALSSAAGVPAAVTNDAALLVPAAGLTSGIGVISGTGSIAVAVRPGGGLMFAGGWGWVIGDEGSAPALVREAVRAALTRNDTGDGGDVLLSSLIEAFGVPDAVGLARSVNDIPTAEHWAPKAPAVFAAAARGSADARAVIRAGAESLAYLVGVLAARGAGVNDVVAAGGVMTGQPELFSAFRDAVTRDHPGLTVHLLSEPPVTGAVALARRLQPEEQT